MPNIPPRVNVLGVNISITNIPNALVVIERWIEYGKRHYVCVTGVHGVMECQKDKNLKHIHNASGLTVPDGMPLVWVGRLKGFSQMARVYGPDFMQEICKISLKKNYSHFLFGGKPRIVKKLQANLEQKFPGINITGTFTPPFRPLNQEEELQLTNQVMTLSPDIFWVGLSTPKQERFMAEYIRKLDTKVMLGVGAAFDIHSLSTKDAPEWIKRIGMQWFHRLISEPKRLWKRYFKIIPSFVFFSILQLTGLRKF